MTDQAKQSGPKPGDFTAQVKHPHCPECKASGNDEKNPLLLNSAIEPAGVDPATGAPSASLIRMTTWCQGCGCILGMLTLPAPAMGIGGGRQPSPFDRGPSIFDADGRPKS